jgi:hypothetical protein
MVFFYSLLSILVGVLFEGLYINVNDVAKRDCSQNSLAHLITVPTGGFWSLSYLV